MKKLISMLLITLMAFSLVACGGDDVANTDPGTSSADPGMSGQTAS